MKKNVFLNIPVLGDVPIKAINSIYRNIFSSQLANVNINIQQGESLIQRARNNAITTFIENIENYDYFMSIDSDIVILNDFCIIDKFINNNLDFQCALYPIKDEKSIDNKQSPKCASIIDYNLIKDIEQDIIEIEYPRYTATGCWFIEKNVILSMKDSYTEDIYDGDGYMEGRKIYGLYNTYVKTINLDNKPFKKLLSEDYAFCDRYYKNNMFSRIYVDKSIKLGHIGKYTYKLE